MLKTNLNDYKKNIILVFSVVFNNFLELDIKTVLVFLKLCSF